MNRILFLLERPPSQEERNILKERLIEAGYVVGFEDIGDEVCPAQGLLIVTDSRDVLGRVQKLGSDALVYLNSEDEISNYPGGKYFVIDAAECEADYFLKIYCRINSLPWEVYRTERLTVRETTESDIDVFYRIYEDPLVKAYMEPLYEKREDELLYLKKYRDNVYACQDFGIWTLIESSSGNIVGRGGLNYKANVEGIETGFVIAPEYRGMGFAKEAVESFLSFADKHELGDVYALVMPGNIPSQSLLRKLGFEYVRDTVEDGNEYRVFCCKK